MRRALLLLCLLTGCAFDERVAGDAVISCQGATECPEGFFCQASVGRCVRLLSPGLAPPALLGPAVVSPTLAARGAPLRVLFQVNEPLARPPVVRAVYSSGASAEATLVDLELPPRSFTAELLPAADAPEGAVRFFVDLLDTDGAEATDLDLGAAVLDFTAPALVRGSAALTLTPSSTNQLSRVEAMNETTLAQLTFAVTEPLAAAPALSVTTDGGAQAFSVRYAGSTGTSHLFSLTLTSAAVPQGPASLGVALEDLAGNRATLPLELKAPGLVIDTEAPPFSGLSDGGVVLRRAPTGAAFRFGTRGTGISGAPGVTEPGATIIASETPTSPDLARTTASSTGAFELALPADLAGVTVRALDSAGNQSTPTLVRQVSWFASLSGSAPGVNNPNPHRAFSTRVLGPTPEPPGALEHYGSSGLDAVGGAAVLTTGAANWRRLWPGAPSITGVSTPGGNRVLTAWDPFRARVVVVDAPGSFNTWEGNGSGWQLMVPSDPEGDGNPIGASQLQSTGGIAFDEDARLVLLVTGSGTQRSTWAWNGGSWALLTTDSATRCTGCTLAWDSRRRRVLLFDPPTGTTAAWNSGARTWQFLTLATAPSLLATGPSLAFERHSGRWLRFGGSPVHDETWAFDGTAWSLVADGGPSPRWGALTGYDPVSQRVLLHGGSTDAGLLRDTWAWDGQRWALLSDAGLPRGTGSMVVAPALGQTLLVGHGPLLSLQGDGGFAQVANSATPEARSGLATTWSPFHDALLFAGGVNISDGGQLRATVQGLGPSGFFNLPPLPEARHRGALAADARTGRLYFVGGLQGDGGPSDSTFMTTDAGDWLTLDAGRRFPDGGSWPPPRSEPMAWVDPAQGSLVMLGGREATFASGAAFRLTAAGWVDGGLSPQDYPGCVWGGAAMHAPDGGVLVAAGFGSTPLSSCSVQNWLSAVGNAWFVASGGLEPALQALLNVGHAPRAWDERAEAWLSFGGQNGSAAGTNEPGTATLRAWWPNAWSVVPFADTDGDGSPGPRIRHAMGFMRARQATVLYGGESQRWPWDDAWELQLSGTQPALLFRVRLQDALPRGAAPVALVLEGVAGADDGDGGRPGVSARAWHRQRWLDLGPAGALDGGASLATAALLEAFVVQVRDPVLLRELLEEPSLTVALVPTHGFWRGPPRLAVDFLEVRLDSVYPESAP